MNKCMMQIIDVIDKLDSMPNDKHLHIIVDTIDDDKKIKLMECISLCITKESVNYLITRTRKGSNIIAVYLLKTKDGSFSEEELKKMNITIDYSHIIHNPFDLKINRIEYVDRGRYNHHHIHSDQWIYV